jgi:tetratricopeptide (TPR) repeat protein
MKKKKGKPKKPKSLLEKILIIATILGGIAAIGYFADKVFFPPASKKEVKELEKKVGEMAEYLDGLPQTKNPKLKSLFEKGYSLYEDEKYSEAIDTFKACLKLKTEDSEREALLILIGRAFEFLGKLKESEDHFQEALLIGKRIDDQKGKVAALNNIVLIYKAKGDLDQALKYLDEALKIDKEMGNKQGEASDLGNIGLIYSRKAGSASGGQDKGDLDQALKYQKEALKIDQEISNKQGEATDLGNIGLIYQAKGDLDQALKYYQEALVIHREIGFRGYEARDLVNIGTVYYIKGNLNRALKYLEDALKVDKELGFRMGEATDLAHIGLIHKTKGDLDKAIKYLNDARKIFEEIGMPEQIGIVKGNIERVSQQMKKQNK